MESYKDKERFTFVSRAKSFTHAGRGVHIFIRTTHNAWIQCGIVLVAVFAGYLLNISRIDWMFLALGAGLVLAAEAFNTAIEIDINLTSPEFHPFARDTKDVAAGAVLISAVTAAIIGVGIFGHYILDLLR